MRALTFLLAGLISFAPICGAKEYNLSSPDGKTTLSVYQQPNGTTYTIEKNTSIQGVREYVGLYFSANSRYHLFVYEDGRIGHQFYLYDYETTLSGGQNPEIPCKIAPDFQEELTQNGMWVSIAFRFQNWHETENCILLTYTYTLVDGTEVSGEIWWDVEKGTVSKK